METSSFAASSHHMRSVTSVHGNRTSIDWVSLDGLTYLVWLCVVAGMEMSCVLWDCISCFGGGLERFD